MPEKIMPQSNKNYPVQDYINLNRQNSEKYEFAGGKILQTAGTNRTHNLIVTNLTIAVGSRMKGGKSEIYVNNMLVQLNPERFTYPDVVIVSGKPSYADQNEDILLNPAIVVEVFSKNANFFEKNEKLECYLAMPSVREYVSVKEDEMRVEHYTKQNAKQFIYRIYNDGDDFVSLDSINCKISVAEIYARIDVQKTDKPAAIVAQSQKN